MLKFIIKLLMKVSFSLMLLIVVLGFFANSGAFKTLNGLGIHIGITDIIHPDRLLDSNLKRLEQNLNAQID